MAAPRCRSSRATARRPPATWMKSRSARSRRSWNTSASSRNAARPSSNPDRKSTRLNSSHVKISYAVFCLKKKKKNSERGRRQGARGKVPSRRIAAHRPFHSRIPRAASGLHFQHAYFFFFFNDPATTEIYTLSLHDALPICALRGRVRGRGGSGHRPLLHLTRFRDRKSTRLNSSHVKISYAVFCLKKKK